MPPAAVPRPHDPGMFGGTGGYPGHTDSEEDGDDMDHHDGWGYGGGYHLTDSDDEGSVCSACDCDCYDYDRVCAGCGHMQGSGGLGLGLGGYPGYMGGGYGYGYGGPSTAPHRLNAWTVSNQDHHFYRMGTAAKKVLQEPTPAKFAVFKASPQDLRDAAKIGTMHFPVKVC